MAGRQGGPTMPHRGARTLFFPRACCLCFTLSVSVLLAAALAVGCSDRVCAPCTPHHFTLTGRVRAAPAMCESLGARTHQPPQQHTHLLQQQRRAQTTTPRRCCLCLPCGGDVRGPLVWKTLRPGYTLCLQPRAQRTLPFYYPTPKKTPKKVPCCVVSKDEEAEAAATCA